MKRSDWGVFTFRPAVCEETQDFAGYHLYGMRLEIKKAATLCCNSLILIALFFGDLGGD
jgi:hypothetical protein